MLGNNFKESCTNSVCVNSEFDTVIWKEIVNLMYLGYATISSKNAIDLYLIAKFLLMKDLEVFCDAFIEKAI